MYSTVWQHSRITACVLDIRNQKAGIILLHNRIQVISINVIKEDYALILKQTFTWILLSYYIKIIFYDRWKKSKLKIFITGSALKRILSNISEDKFLKFFFLFSVSSVKVTKTISLSIKQPPMKISIVIFHSTNGHSLTNHWRLSVYK